MKKSNMTLNGLRAMFFNRKDPEDFGPEYWAFLHTQAAQINYSKAFLDEFTSAIPCENCREHFKEIPHPKEGESFLLWSYYAHDKVNKRLGKKSPHILDFFAKYIGI